MARAARPSTRGHRSISPPVLGFRGGKSLNMTECVQQRDLEIDLLAAQRGRAGQGPYMCKRTSKLFDDFNEC
jgi:hypothetical protein